VPSLPSFDPPTEHNPKTSAKFRKDSWWEITFPMLMVIVVMLACTAGTYLIYGAEGTAVVADYAIILWSLPILFGGLVFLLISTACIYGVLLLIAQLPPYTFVAQKAMFGIRDRVVGISDKITSIMIQVLSVIGVISQYIQNLGTSAKKAQTGTSGTSKQQHS